MLILTRKAKEAIVIDGHTTVRVLSIDRDRVKIGIDAPRSVVVLREELLARVAGENREAAGTAGAAALTRFRALERHPAPSDDAPGYE